MCVHPFIPLSYRSFQEHDPLCFFPILYLQHLKLANLSDELPYEACVFLNDTSYIINMSLISLVPYSRLHRTTQAHTTYRWCAHMFHGFVLPHRVHPLVNRQRTCATKTKAVRSRVDTVNQETEKETSGMSYRQICVSINQ